MRTHLSIALTAGAALAQGPAFEAASIKPPSPPEDVRTYGNRVLPGRIDFQTATIRYAIAYAYGVKEHQVSGPSWLDATRWQIVAKAPEGASNDRMPEMMRALLAERFRVQVHRDSKEMDVLALTVAEDGPRLKPVERAGSYRVGKVGGGGGRIEAEGMSMEMLARTLTNVLGRPVLDRTTLSGFYRFTIEYADYEAVGGTKIILPAGALPNLASGDPGTSVFRSIQRLGLKLTPQKGRMDVIVVDHAERAPTEN